MKLKTFSTANKTINKTKRQPMEWEKIFVSNVNDEGLISKIFKQLIQLNIKKKILKMCNKPKQTFLKKRYTDNQ